MRLDSAHLACVGVMVALAACTSGAVKPVAAPVVREAPSVVAPPATPAPSHIEAVASDPWGRSEGLSLPPEALSGCIRDAAPNTSGWLLLRVEFEVLPRPTRIEVVEREGLTDPIATCVVAAIANHDELQYLAQQRFVYVTAW